jgi:hypothetical protein
MNNLEQKDFFSVPVAPIIKPLVLEVKGSVPSFKNSKMLVTRGPHGRPLPRPMLVTKPEYQKRMSEIEESFVLQLLSAFRTEEGQTLTGSSLRCAIALSVPADDCWLMIPEIHIRGELCLPGQEGATVTIERIK